MKKTESGIPNTFKGSVLEFGAVPDNKVKNSRESFQNLQESVLHYVVANYKKRVDLTPLNRKL